MRTRVVIITGGGTGIGRAAALQFAQAGAWVGIVGRRAAPLEEAARASDRIVPFPMDILSDTDRQNLLAMVAERWGRLDVLVNNAGGFAYGPLESISPQDVTSLFAMNVLAPTLMTQAALPLLKAFQGAIVNVSSTFGHKAGEGFSHYAASKAALEHLTRCWALELAPDHIRVNAVAPGPTETDILRRSGLSAAEVEQIERDEAAAVPLERRGKPDDVAAWIVNLSSSTAAWLTGQILAVDGGLSVA